MGYIKEKTGWDIGDPIMSLGNVAEKVGGAIVSAVEGIGKTVEGILKDPLPTLLQVGGAMIGIPPYVTAAVITGARGGNLEDIAKSAAVSYISSQAMSGTNIGKTISDVTKTAGQDFTNSMMENFSLPPDTAIAISKAATASLNSSIIGGVNAAISGKSVMDGITSGFTSGLIYSSTNSYFDSLNKDPNWGFSPKTLDLMKGASSSALNSIVSGKGDPAQAVGNYIASAFIGMGESKLKQAANEAWVNLTTDTDAAKAAQDKYITAKAELDRKANEGEALRKEINADSAAYQSTITEKYNPFKASYDKLVADSSTAVNTYNDQKAVYESNISSYNNYAAIAGQYGGHYEYRSAGDADYEVFISHAPSRDSFLSAANTAAAAANAAAKNAEAIQASALKLYEDNKPMIDGLTSGKAKIDQKVADFQAIKTDIENPLIPGSTAANLKAASDVYQTKYDAWSKTKAAADRSAETYTKALAQAATRDATIDALNTGAIKVTSKDADSNWFLSNGMILTNQGKFVQDGQQVFSDAAGVPQKAMDFKANDGSNVDFSSNAGRLLSETDVVNICKRDYGFEPTSDELDRLAGAAYTATGNPEITALADQKATAAFRSVTGTDPTADELAAIKKTNNVVGSAISLAKTGDADPWGDLEGAMLKGSSGEPVKLTDAQMTDMVRKGLVFEGGDYSTKQDAANAARLAGYTQFEYDNGVYTMQPGGPTEKAVFQAAIDMQPNRGEAFNTARKLLGADKTFDYKGAAFTTETREERNARQYNSDAAIQARVDLIPAYGGARNTQTGTPANVTNTFIDQKTNQVVEDTRVWDAAGNVVSGSLNVADPSKTLQVAGSLALDAGTQVIDAFTGVGKFLGAIDKNSEFASKVNQLVSFNEAQKPPEVKAESAQFWSNVKNAQGIADTARVVLSSVVDQPLMTGFNIASEMIQTLGTLGAGAGVKYASALLKAAPALSAKLGIGVDAVLNIGESAGATYNESYKKALASVGAQVRDGSMTAAQAEAYAEDTAGKTFLAAAGMTGAMMLLPGGNALAKQVLGSGAENAAMKASFKEAIKSDAAKAGYNLAAGTAIKEAGSEGAESFAIEAAKQKILSPDADYNWKDLVVTPMLGAIYGGGHSAAIASADIAVSNFQDKLVLSGATDAEVANLTNKVSELVKSGNATPAAIESLKTETSNLLGSIGYRVDPTLDLMSDQFLSGIVSQEVAGEMSRSGMSPEQIAKNLAGAVTHVESGNRIDPTYVDPFLTDDAEARQIAQKLGYANPSPEVIKSLTGSISEVDAQAKLDEFLKGMTAFESGKPVTAAAAQEMVKDLGLSGLSDSEAISLATKIVQSVPADKLSEPKMTPEQVRSIIDEIIVANPTLTEVQVGKIVNDAIAKIPAGVSTSDISSLVTTAISNIPKGLSIEDVSKVVTDATKNLTTKLDTEKAISDAIGKISLPAGITSADVTSAIKTYMTQNPGLSLADVAGKITESTKGLATDTSVQNAISTALKGVATTADVNAAISNIKFPAGLSKDDVANSIATYMKANPGLSLADVALKITDATKGLATSEGMKTDIAAAIKGITSSSKERDADLALQMVVGKVPVDLAYDANKDGKITSADAIAISKGTYAVPSASSTRISTAKDITDAIAGIKFPAGITPADVTLAIDNYMKANPGLSLKQVADAITTGTSGLATDAGVKTSISDALKGVATKTDVSDAIKGIVFPAGLSKDDVANSIASYMKANPGLSLTDVATKITDATKGLVTSEGMKTALSNGLKGLATTKDVETAISNIKFPAGISKEDVSSAIKTYMEANPGLSLADVAAKITDATKGLATSAGVKTDMAAAIKGLATTKDVETAISNIKFPAGLSKADVAEQIKEVLKNNPGLSAADVTKSIAAYMTANPGLTAADVGTAITNATKNLVTSSALSDALANSAKDVKDKFDTLNQAQKNAVDAQVQQGKDLTKAINDASSGLQANIDALSGTVKTQYDSLTQAQKDAIADQVQQGKDLNKAITDSASGLQTQITGLTTDVKTQYDALTQAQKDAVASQVQQGKDLTKAIADTASGLQGSIDALSGEVKTQYDSLTQAQKDAIAGQVQQGKDLTKAIADSASGLQTQITGLSEDSQAKYNALTQGQKDIVAAQAKQGIDVNAAIAAASKLATEQVTDVKKDVGVLRTDVQAKYDLLDQGQKDIVATQVKLGVDVNKAIDDAAKATTQKITEVKTGLSKEIGEAQSQFNIRVDDLVKQGLTYQTATQKALDEIKATQTAEAAKAEAAAKSGRAAKAQAGIAQNLQQAVARVTPSPGLVDTSTPGFANIGLKTSGEAKFEGPLEQYMKMLSSGSYAAKPQESQQTQQVAPVQDELSAQQQPGTDYFNYGQQTDIDLGLSPGTDMLYSKAGGLATPLFAGGGTTRHGRYAGGGLNVVQHAGKARIDFRTGNAVTGPGDGQSDDIPAMLADGEFVFPADVVAALGNGSTKAGSDKLYDMMHSIRAYHRSAKPQDLPPPAKKSPLDYLKKPARKVRR